MLNIDEKELELLLEKRKKKIERPRYDGLGEVISSVSLIVTLVLSDFSHLTFIKPVYFKIIVWGISIAVLVRGIYAFIKSITDVYSIGQLYSEISDIDPRVEHPFDIIVIKNEVESGKYLVFKSKGWNCWLFPNYHCLTGDFSKTKELKQIKERVRKDLGISAEINFKYIGNEISRKYSFRDKVNKKYNFHYFQAVDAAIDFKGKRTFRCNGKKYCWKTLDQMYASRNIVRKNRDVLDYVRRMCDIG